MRILLVITRSELGGAQTVVAELANRFCGEHEVVVAAGEGDGKLFEMLDSRVTRVECKHLQRALSPLKDLRAVIELRRIYRRYRPDVVHLHSSKAATLGRVAFPRQKIVYTVHGFDSIRVAFRKFLPIERALQHRSRAIVAVSNYDKHNLENEGINNNIVTIHNGLQKPCIAIEPGHKALFERYGKVVLCIARLSAPKLPELFVATARELPDYGFVWIGNQEGVESLGETPSNCHFLGNIVSAGGYCSLADIFMLPSNYEGLPMVIIEAMSHGCPVVASNVGGISEIVENGVNGYVVNNAAKEFAEKISYILAEPKRYEQFSGAAEQTYIDSLTADKMANKYLAIYKSIL